MNDNSDTDDHGARRERRQDGRASVDIDCEIRVGNRAWRKARIKDLTPEGFQVEILDMPPKGTPVAIRFAGMQMLQAETRWGKVDVAGCRFKTPLSPYVFEHVVATSG